MRISVIGFCVFACTAASKTTSYDPVQDDAAMAAITRAWAGDSAALSLCEDTVTAASQGEDNCIVAHVVRGQGLGTTHSKTTTSGCGGCPYGNDAYVVGTVSGGGVAPGTQVSGRVYVGENGNAYSYPYAVELYCTDQAHACSITGTLEADGSLALTIESNFVQGSGLTSSVDVTLAPTGAATCQATP